MSFSLKSSLCAFLSITGAVTLPATFAHAQNAPQTAPAAEQQTTAAAPVSTPRTTPSVFDQNGKYTGTNYAYDFNRRIDYLFNGRLSELPKWKAAEQTFPIFDQYKADTEALYARIGTLYDRVDGKDGGKKPSTAEHNQIVAQIQQLNTRYEYQRNELDQMTAFVAEKSGGRFNNMPEFRAWYDKNKPEVMASNIVSVTPAGPNGEPRQACYSVTYRMQGGEAPPLNVVACSPLITPAP